MDTCTGLHAGCGAWYAGAAARCARGYRDCQQLPLPAARAPYGQPSRAARLHLDPSPLDAEVASCAAAAAVAASGSTAAGLEARRVGQQLAAGVGDLHFSNLALGNRGDQQSGMGIWEWPCGSMVDQQLFMLRLPGCGLLNLAPPLLTAAAPGTQPACSGSPLLPWESAGAASAQYMVSKQCSGRACVHRTQQ